MRDEATSNNEGNTTTAGKLSVVEAGKRSVAEAATRSGDDFNTGQAGKTMTCAVQRAKRANFNHAQLANPKVQRINDDGFDASNADTPHDLNSDAATTQRHTTSNDDGNTTATHETHTDFMISDFRSDRGDGTQSRIFDSGLGFSISGQMKVTKRRGTALKGSSDADSDADDDGPPN